jgi:ribosome biogenesis GTPase
LTLPSRLKKEGVDVLVGDIVEVDPFTSTVVRVFPRKSQLTRPKAANIDFALLVISITDPKPELEHLDRVLFHASVSLPVKPIICVTKVDLENKIDELLLYKNLGFRLMQISNKSLLGIEELKNELKGSLCVLAGQSGVGKSSILRSMFPGKHFKVGDVSHKSLKGTHTTRSSEIFYHEECDFMILDTPGFSRLDALESAVVVNNPIAFPEIELAERPCLYPDCKHLDEEGCSVVFSSTRKTSYRKLMNEAEQWEKLQKIEGKDQLKVKNNTETKIPLLKSSLRETSRKSKKQSFNREIDAMNSDEDV